MTEIVGEEGFEFGALFDVDDEQLASRVLLIRQELQEKSKTARAAIPSLDDHEITKNEMFKKWMVCNLIVEASERDAFNADFNRMMYFMYENTGNNLDYFLSQYDIETVKDSKGNLLGFNLLVIKLEDEDE